MLLDKRRVRQAFNRAAKTYDHHAQVQQQVATTLSDLLVHLPIQPKCIVDLGAGTGFMQPLLRQYFPDALIVQIDLAEFMLQYSRAKHADQNSVWICGDMDCNPLPAQCADLVVSNLAIQWSANRKHLLQECQRILTPSGHWLFSTLGPQSLQEIRYAHRTSLHPGLLTQQDLTQWLAEHDFAAPKWQSLLTHTEFDTPLEALNSVKGVGAQTLPQQKKHLSALNLQALSHRYDALRLDNGKLPLTYEVILGLTHYAA